jgi:hypothetical protein
MSDDAWVSRRAELEHLRAKLLATIDAAGSRDLPALRVAVDRGDRRQTLVALTVGEPRTTVFGLCGLQHPCLRKV